MKKLLPFVLVVLGCSTYPQANYRDNQYQDEINKNTSRTAVNPVFIDPAVALIIGGVGLASNSDFYRKNTVSGRCTIVSEKESLVEIPCKENVQVVLKTRAGKELARSTPQGGEFAFKVSKDQEYSLAAEAKGYELTNKDLHAVLGDQVVLKLKKRKD